MALPKLVTAKYPVTIPSTKKNTFFRPFLMREQKVLMMAMESNDQEQILNAICDIVKVCVDGVENPGSMPMFDLEYLFLRIRAKSVGELIDVTLKCPNCGRNQPKQINLDDVSVYFNEEVSSKIMLTDKMGVIMRYPCLRDSVQDIANLNAEGIVKFICNSIDLVFDEATTYTRKDFTHEEIQNFVESMSTSQFENISKFYQNLPQLKKTVECKCSGCEKDFSLDFRGLTDFFT